MQCVVYPSNSPLTGIFVVPGDKSISHRALLLGALQDKQVRVNNFLPSDDCLATLQILIQLGVEFERITPEGVLIYGVGIQGFKYSESPLDCGNSGTSMRLLAGILAAQQFDSMLTGDKSLVLRPMRRIIKPLRSMGADIRGGDGDTAPLHIRGGQHLIDLTYTPKVASAQVKSCLLLAGMCAGSKTLINEKILTRDHTERMLSFFAKEKLSKQVSISIPGDISSAAFFIVAASIIPGSYISLKNVGINPTRTGVIDVLRAMGANIIVQEYKMQRSYALEPRATITVRYAKLRGVNITHAIIPRLIDEIPILMVAASVASGITGIYGAVELRHKESDRISAMVSGLETLGVDVVEKKDGVTITGSSGGRLLGGKVQSLGDHRVAMSYIIAGLIAKSEVRIDDVSNIKTSFPDFFTKLELLNCQIQTVI
jgi:3-phosphoshikimate 1-carboxyvinyltransferase